jgi:hypothetical protein
MDCASASVMSYFKALLKLAAMSVVSYYPKFTSSEQCSARQQLMLLAVGVRCVNKTFPDRIVCAAKESLPRSAAVITVPA